MRQSQSEQHQAREFTAPGIMSDWIEQYSTALTERDAREQAHKFYIDAYTRLADHTAILEGRSSVTEPTVPSGKDGPQPAANSKGTQPQEQEQIPNDVLARLRADLATTQKARSGLQTQIEGLTASLAALQTQSKSVTARVTQLTKQKTDLEIRLRDRDEEIKGKSQLVEQAHDEMVALGLQLNMAEQKAEELRKENHELVDRWMKRMGEEADRMNNDSKWQ